MVCLLHPSVQITLAAQRFGRISGRPGKCFEGREFCFVRNRLGHPLLPHYGVHETHVASYGCVAKVIA